MEYNFIDSKSNKIFIILHTPKSSLSKVHFYTAAFICVRYRSFSGDKNINCGINEALNFVKECFILILYQPKMLSHEFQNYGVIRLL
jgi:hypothetical protein